MAREEQAGSYHFSRDCDKPYTHTTRGDGFILTDRWRLQTIGWRGGLSSCVTGRHHLQGGYPRLAHLRCSQSSEDSQINPRVCVVGGGLDSRWIHTPHCR